MRLKIGKKVAVLRFNVRNNRDKFEVGKIVGVKTVFGVKNVAVMFSDGKIGMYYESELFKKWDKSYEEQKSRE